MKCDPLVSIITPSYNQGEFIEETIQSVLAQTYEHIEYIIIDGGSTDNSVEIIKRYDSHISYWVSEKDSGQSSAINKGFALANGELVGWINSDDILKKDAVESVVNAATENPRAILFHGQLIMMDRNGEYLRMAKCLGRDMTFDRLINGTDQVSQPGSFYLKAAVDKVGGLDETLFMTMDFDLWAKLLSVGEGKFIDKSLACLRVHDDAKTSLHTKLQCKEMFRNMRKYGGHFWSRRYLGLLLLSFRALIGNK